MQQQQTTLTEPQIREVFQKAKEWMKAKFAETPDFTILLDEPALAFIDDAMVGWDLLVCPDKGKIKVNLYRLRWYLERERQLKMTPKYDLESAFAHDLFEYCYYRRWNLPLSDPAVRSIVHHRAWLVENKMRAEKGLGVWI